MFPTTHNGQAITPGHSAYGRTLKLEGERADTGPMTGHRATQSTPGDDQGDRWTELLTRAHALAERLTEQNREWTHRSRSILLIDRHGSQ